MTDWLTTQPIAHRGLHNESGGIVENTIAAFEAAIAGGYAIETDLQCSADFEPFVFHDSTLDRLTHDKGQVIDFTANELKKVTYLNADQTIQSLVEFCGQINGQTALLIEVKTLKQYDRQYTERIAEIMRDYAGPYALMSFDPRIMADFRKILPNARRGIVADRSSKKNRPYLNALQRFKLRHLLYSFMVRPQFIAYDFKALPALAPLTAKTFGLSLLAWTVESDDDRTTALRYADNIIFQGFKP